MGSSGKTRTTFAKLNRESKLREKRAEKEARKTARRFDAAGAGGDTDQMSAVLGTDSSDPDLVGPDGPDLLVSDGPDALVPDGPALAQP